MPIDLGGTIMSGIMAHALDRLQKHLGINRRVKVYEVFQMLGEVELDIADRLGVDVLPVEPLVAFFGLRRERYKPWTLFDGTEVLVPGQFEVEVTPQGDWLLHDEGDPSRPVSGRMPRDGFYFDMQSMTAMVPDFRPPPLDEFRKTAPRVTAEDLDFLVKRASRLRRETDKALLLGWWGTAGLNAVGSIPDFLCLLISDPEYVKDLFELQAEIAVENISRLWDALGDMIDVFGLDGHDYGSQNSMLFSPDVFAELFVPYYKLQTCWIHENTTWKAWKHTCGAVRAIIPHMIEAGIDILNPVQTSAADMDPASLKEAFGGQIVFWGGGVDTQKTLPFGSTDEVREEVRERVQTLGRGGGFVFNPVHNIQQGVPPENILAAFDAAREARVG